MDNSCLRRSRLIKQSHIFVWLVLLSAVVLLGSRVRSDRLASNDPSNPRPTILVASDASSPNNQQLKPDRELEGTTRLDTAADSHGLTKTVSLRDADLIDLLETVESADLEELVEKQVEDVVETVQPAPEMMEVDGSEPAEPLAGAANVSASDQFEVNDSVMEGLPEVYAGPQAAPEQAEVKTADPPTVEPSDKPGEDPNSLVGLARVAATPEESETPMVEKSTPALVEKVPPTEVKRVTPQTISSGQVVVEVNPLPPVMNPVKPRILRIENPQRIGYPVAFLYGDEQWRLLPGEVFQRALTQPNGAAETIQFDRGGDFGESSLQLEPGDYLFTVTRQGWKIIPSKTFKSVSNLTNENTD